MGAATSALDIDRTIKDVSAPPPPRAPDRDFKCPVCGQMVDRLNLAEVDYHGDHPHEPRSEKA